MGERGGDSCLGEGVFPLPGSQRGGSVSDRGAVLINYRGSFQSFKRSFMTIREGHSFFVTPFDYCEQEVYYY